MVSVIIREVSNGWTVSVCDVSIAFYEEAIATSYAEAETAARYLIAESVKRVELAQNAKI